jgi:hypothetical protein
LLDQSFTDELLNRDVDFVSISMSIILVTAGFAGISFCKSLFFPSSMPSVMKDKSRQSLLHGIQDLESLKIIEEDSQNMCVAWREIDGCIIDGSRNPFKDRNCSTVILPAQAGWCDCKEPAGSLFHIEFDCDKADHPKRIEAFTCARVCSSRIRDGLDKSRKLLRAEQASSTYAEELDRRWREEKERKRREEEELELVLRPIRKLILHGDDLLAKVSLWK